MESTELKQCLSNEEQEKDIIDKKAVEKEIYTKAQDERMHIDTWTNTIKAAEAVNL